MQMMMKRGVLDKVMEQDCHGVMADNSGPYTVKVQLTCTLVGQKVFRHCSESVITQLDPLCLRLAILQLEQPWIQHNTKEKSYKMYSYSQLSYMHVSFSVSTHDSLFSLQSNLSTSSYKSFATFLLLYYHVNLSNSRTTFLITLYLILTHQTSAQPHKLYTCIIQ